MTVSKRFRWEAAHRLPWHEEGCQHLHGHSYEMWILLEGDPDERGMVIDFKEIKEIMTPLMDAWDHSVLVGKDDKVLLDALALLESKHYVLPYDTTSENLCRFVAEYLLDQARQVLVTHRISGVIVRVQETETCFAEIRYTIDQPMLSEG